MPLTEQCAETYKTMHKFYVEDWATWQSPCEVGSAGECVQFLMWLNDFYINEVFFPCSYGYNDEILVIKPYMSIYDSPLKDIDLFCESLTCNKEETMAALNQIAADMQAGKWFAAGVDTAALIDIVAFKGSESQ